MLLLLAEKPNEKLQAPYPKHDLQTPKKVLFSSKRPMEDRWPAEAFPSIDTAGISAPAGPQPGTPKTSP